MREYRIGISLGSQVGLYLRLQRPGAIGRVVPPAPEFCLLARQVLGNPGYEPRSALSHVLTDDTLPTGPRADCCGLA